MGYAAVALGLVLMAPISLMIWICIVTNLFDDFL